MKYELVNPSKSNIFANLSIFTIKVKCKKDDCSNLTFGTLDKCALHCEKGSYRTDWYNGLLLEFTSLLNNYILSYFTDDYYRYKGLNQHANQLVYELRVYLNNSRNLYQSSVIERFFCEVEIIFLGVIFPTRDSRDDFDYFKTLEMFKGIHFIDCGFYLGDINIKNIEFFFQSCCFESEFTIKPITLLDNVTDSLFSECTFNEITNIIPIGDDNSIGNTLFSGCTFESDLNICDMNFKKELFSCEGSSKNKFSNLTVLSCIFEVSFKLNLVEINKLCIEDTEFQSKFEIKETTVKVFNFKNSNVDKLFDAFGSEFEKSYFYKSIFTDFAGFEKVVFGLEVKDIEEYQAKFIYTTFMSFSNFRSTKFLSGLDFENSNLKEQPNFLKTEVSPKNTNRETFRIIKHSFDDIGNKIEANRFFIKEMKAYKRELDDGSDTWDKWVYRANEEISDFGRSYTKPIKLLFWSIIIYTSCLSIHKSYFEENIYFLHPWFDALSKLANEFAKNFLPFSRFLAGRSGVEFISLAFYIWFAVLIWQIIVSVKRHTQR